MGRIINIKDPNYKREEMDLKRELESIQNGSSDELRNQLYQEQNEIAKKIYIVTILEAVKIIDQMLVDNIYNKFGSNMIQLHYYYEPDVGNVIEFDLLDKYEVKIPIYARNFPREIADVPNKAKDLLFSLNGFNGDFINADFKEGNYITFEIKSGLGAKVLDLLLSQEFKKELDFNQMQLSLGENNRSDSKKMKV